MTNSLTISEEKRNHWIAEGENLGLSYCDCHHYPLPTRLACEEKILQLASRVLSNHLTVLSIGSGESLQDFLVLKQF